MMPLFIFHFHQLPLAFMTSVVSMYFEINIYCLVNIFVMILEQFDSNLITLGTCCSLKQSTTVSND